jgi:TolA-binding protein
MYKLILIVLSFFIVVSCSKLTDQQYLDQAKNLLKENKVNEAVSSYKSIIEDYPDSKLAPKALVELANLYQNQLDKNLPPAESFDMAQKYFREVYDKYPNSEEASKALFMSAFILANELKRYDDATEAYKLFIEKFPRNPLAVSAQEELDNMGLSPEEILKKKEVVKN